MDPIIKIENLSKQYRLGVVGTGTLNNDLKRWWYKTRGKEDPFLKIGESNDRNSKGNSDYVWALKDINLEVMPGEVLGIIGKNGAGKSTLLKILSKVTGPTTGSISFNGRIGSLLEVGTGFHPELTGRENIFLNGAILGMTKAEIRSKLDEIIDFSGVERYIDTPVKRYSSGMMVRLGFAVAAHLEPEILVVDEVLAVGDAEFQKKAIGKMKDVSKGEGRTVLFVSHNMTAIEALCDHICVLQNGRVDFLGDTLVGIKRYLNHNYRKQNIEIPNQIKALQLGEEFQLLNFEICQGIEKDNFTISLPIKLKYEYIVKKEILGLRIGFDIIDYSNGNTIFRTFHDDHSERINTVYPGKYISNTEIPSNLLNEGSYLLSLSIGIHNIKWLVYNQIYILFSCYNIRGINNIYADKRPGVIMPLIKWDNKKI